MDFAPVAPLVFLWWNTSLAPPVAKLKATATDREFVVEQIGVMRDTVRFAVLGLCEVQSSDLAAIMLGLGDPNLRLIDKTARNGQLKFDTALIYDQTQLIHVDSRSFVERYGKRSLKLGEMLTFVTVSTGIVIHVVLSHWPSRRSVSESDPKRTELGTLLRASLAAWRRDPQAYIVLMGDYNDDPFSPSLASHLLATRDRELARRDPRYFYNPFWRWLGESLPTAIAGSGASVCGTHYYRGGEQTEWFTYDQIIFTSAFLNGGDALLDETLTKIVSTPALAASLQNTKHVCDHFPVMSTVNLKMRASS